MYISATTNECCHAYHTFWMGHVTHINEPRYTSAWSVPRVKMNHVTCQEWVMSQVTCHIYKWVMVRIRMIRAARKNESCHTYRMSHVTHKNESCHTWRMSHITHKKRDDSQGCATRHGTERHRRKTQHVGGDRDRENFPRKLPASACCSVLQSVSQCVTVCHSVSQCVAVCCSVLQCVTVCCSELQCVAVCYSELQCVTASCSVLQRVAVSCSVL